MQREHAWKTLQLQRLQQNNANQRKSMQIDAIRKAKKINEWIGWSLNLTLDAAALDISGTTSETESVRDPVQDGRSEWRFWRTSEPDWTCISKCVKFPTETCMPASSRPSRGILDNFGHCSCTESLLKTNRVGRCGKWWLLKLLVTYFSCVFIHLGHALWNGTLNSTFPGSPPFKTWVFPDLPFTQALANVQASAHALKWRYIYCT